VAPPSIVEISDREVEAAQAVTFMEYMARDDSSGGSALVAFLCGIVVAAMLTLAGAWLFRAAIWGPPRIDTSRPTVVREIRQLARLETVVFGMDKIVSGGWDSRYLPKALAGDRLLLMVYGEVTAGIDLSHVEASSITIDKRTIRIQLPGAEVFATRVDNEKTRVYSRETGLFSHVDPNLESDVRKEAERQVRQAALDAGVLRLAMDNARLTMTAFLQGLGFEHAEVR
jgi:Protein of unknown function (DUF4230)